MTLVVAVDGQDTGNEVDRRVAGVRHQGEGPVLFVIGVGNQKRKSETDVLSRQVVDWRGRRETIAPDGGVELGPLAKNDRGHVCHYSPPTSPAATLVSRFIEIRQIYDFEDTDKLSIQPTQRCTTV